MNQKSPGTLEEIPVGHYHRVMESGHPVRRAWHLLKFSRVLDLCDNPGGALLDVGCFAGSLLSMASEERFHRQLGVDILAEQVAFAQAHFGTPFRRFQHIETLSELGKLEGPFAHATCVEVIEHLRPEEIRELFLGVAKLLEPGVGRFVLSTPNYASTWPLLELALNRLSDVDYSEQHITRFTYFGLEKKLKAVVPELGRLFELELVTTTHLLSPFLAVFGGERATRIGSFVPHAKWRMPMGTSSCSGCGAPRPRSDVSAGARPRR